MLMEVAEAVILAEQCAPAVAAPTLMSIVRVESGFNPLAIGVNGLPRVIIKTASAADAARQASTLIAAGRSVDLGLAQINSKNLHRLGLTVEDAFDPCRNLAAAARVLQEGYARSRPAEVGAQPALLQALSFYNTGHPRRGFANGYVAKVTAAARRTAPASPKPPARPSQAAPSADTPSWDVFGQSTASEGFVIRIATPVSGGQP
jgi:type IV secretion system protein VirB1